MNKSISKISCAVIFILSFLFYLPVFAQEEIEDQSETITLVTYYPAPIGIYNELRSRRMAIGNTYFDPTQYCFDDGAGICGTIEEISQDTDLAVEGNVGIGTISPLDKLDVAGRIVQSSMGYDVLIGEGSGNNDDFTNNFNVLIGYRAGYHNLTGYSNVVVGRNAGYGSNGNSYVGCTFLGGYAGEYNAADWNTFVGKDAGRFNTTGNQNTCIGHDAFARNSTGYQNTVIGHKAGESNGLSNNYQNTILGCLAGTGISGANFNILLGYQAGDNITSGDSNIIIGYDVDAPSATGSNQLNIGNTIYGNLSTNNVGIGTTDPQAVLDVASTTSGFIPPRMTQVQLNAINATAVEGSIAYNTTDDELNYRDATSWQALGGSGGCYVSYSGSCLAGFTNKGSAGSWGYCYGRPHFLSHFRPAGGVCKSGGVWASAALGMAYVCCQ